MEGLRRVRWVAPKLGSLEPFTAATVRRRSSTKLEGKATEGMAGR